MDSANECFSGCAR